MEKPKLDDTLPGQVSQPQENDKPSSLEDTLITPSGRQSTLQLDLGKTIPTPIRQDTSQAPGLEDTIPPTVDWEAQTGIDFSQVVSTPLNQTPETKPGISSPPPISPKKGVFTGGRFSSMKMLTLLGIVGLFLIAVLSAFGGYLSGINERKGAESTQVALSVQEQFDLGLQDMDTKNYDRARQRFEYVIQHNPNYPGITEKLAEVLLQTSITATPTMVATPTPSPTPDTRGVEELFRIAQQEMANANWTAAIDTLLNIRKADQNYQAVLIDGMLYASFRNRGKDKILKEGDLEGGIYDLKLAERFGPLDADSRGYLNWSRLYILGASFWDVDWSQVVYYFGQVAPALPNLRDGSGWTATERYRLGLINYGDHLASRREWCQAVKQYEIALSYGGNGDVQQAYKYALEKCQGPQAPPTTEAPTEPPPEATEALPEEPTPTVPSP